MEDTTVRTITLKQRGQWIYPIDERGYILSKEEVEDILTELVHFYKYVGKDFREEHNTWLDIKSLVSSKNNPMEAGDRSGYVYVIRAETGEYKIGRSKNVPKRMQLFGIKLPFTFDLILTIPTPDMFKLESLLHQYYKDFRGNGEWFDLREWEIKSLFSLL